MQQMRKNRLTWSPIFRRTAAKITQSAHKVFGVLSAETNNTHTIPTATTNRQQSEKQLNEKRNVWITLAKKEMICFFLSLSLGGLICILLYLYCRQTHAERAIEPECEWIQAEGKKHGILGENTRFKSKKL